MVLIQALDIHKHFFLPGGKRLEVLRGLDLEVPKGRITSITGASGSGKSTLLHLLGGLDTPDRGEILLSGESILEFSQQRRSQYRNQTVGFVYQFHYLMPELDVLENVAFPFLMHRFEPEEARSKAQDLLHRIGLGERSRQMPGQLSGGERQRVAIARSLVNSADLLLADEPTGNLDWRTGEEVFQLLREMIRERGLTAVVVTHNEKLAALTDYTWHLLQGRLQAG